MYQIHSTVPGWNRDVVVFKDCREVLMEDCEVFGGADGVFINKAHVYTKNSDIRFAASRGIFANPTFMVEGVEVSNCGGYGIKTRSSVRRIRTDNEIQRGLGISCDAADP